MPVATSMGGVHPPEGRRESQMPTSPDPYRVPPNQAATRPSRVSTMVEAWALANGALSKMNSEVTIAFARGGRSADAGSGPLFLIAPAAAGDARNATSALAAAGDRVPAAMPAEKIVTRCAPL